MCGGSKSVAFTSEKYATTTKYSWNVKFVGLSHDKNISNTKDNGGWDFMKLAPITPLLQYFIKYHNLWKYLGRALEIILDVSIFLPKNLTKTANICNIFDNHPGLC